MGVIHRAADMFRESLDLNLLLGEEKTEGISLMINRCATVLIKNTRTCQVYGSRTAGLKHDLEIENNRLVLCCELLRQLCFQKYSSHGSL